MCLGWKIDLFFDNIGLKHCEYNHNIYVLHVHGYIFIVALYVDYLVVTRNNVNQIVGLKKQLADTFEMIDVGMLHFFLGIQILQMNDGIFISRPKYALDIFKWINMDDCKSCATPYHSRVKFSKERDSPGIGVIAEKYNKLQYAKIKT